MHETVSSLNLWICSTLAPFVIIAFIALVFVPGSTVPEGTPRALVWKRKLWELHAGWLGLSLSLASAWLITNGVKNLCGRPRPDLVSRCQPDLAHVAMYVVGGIANTTSNGQLVSGDICKNPNKALLDDGFRSYPSGHSSSSAAGLFYLSLYIASKFALAVPFLAPQGYADALGMTAFPSRFHRPAAHSYEPVRGAGPQPSAEPVAAHSHAVAAVRRQAAAPLLVSTSPKHAAAAGSNSRWTRN